jgi:hypothetical protein
MQDGVLENEKPGEKEGDAKRFETCRKYFWSAPVVLLALF